MDMNCHPCAKQYGPFPTDDMLVLVTDGISGRFISNRRSAVTRRNMPTRFVAAGKVHDDALVLVVRHIGGRPSAFFWLHP